MECMRAFREEWGSCVEDGFEGLDTGEKQALKEALKGEWLDNVDRLYRRKVPSLLSADDLNAIRNHFGLDSRSFTAGGQALSVREQARRRSME